MRTLRVAAVIALIGLGAGLGYVSAQGNRSSGALTAQDYIDIEQLYMAYTHAIDFGDSDGRDYAAVFVPDGVFALVIPTPVAAATTACPSVGPWHVADRATIRGSMPDTKGADVCIATLNGSDDLANMAESFHRVNGSTSRHIYTNLRITPTSEGAHGFVYFNQLDVSTKPPTNTVSGIYEDTLVKTPDGWRFKKRVHTHDGPFAEPSAQ